MMNGIWADPDVLGCESQQFLQILSQVYKTITALVINLLQHCQSLSKTPNLSAWWQQLIPTGGGYILLKRNYC